MHLTSYTTTHNYRIPPTVRTQWRGHLEWWWTVAIQISSSWSELQGNLIAYCGLSRSYVVKGKCVSKAQVDGSNMASIFTSCRAESRVRREYWGCTVRGFVVDRYFGKTHRTNHLYIHIYIYLHMHMRIDVYMCIYMYKYVYIYNQHVFWYQHQHIPCMIRHSLTGTSCFLKARGINFNLLRCYRLFFASI